MTRWLFHVKRVRPKGPVGPIRSCGPADAIITAAQAILDRGEAPTVAQAAEDALVSRTTAWRYFPNQASLLVELAVNIDTCDLEDLVAKPLGDDTPADRVLELLDLFNRQVIANERLHRRAMRLFLDTWLHANTDDAPLPSVRGGPTQRADRDRAARPAARRVYVPRSGSGWAEAALVSSPEARRSA